MTGFGATPDASASEGPDDGGGVPDILAPGLSVVFCGINPGRRSGQEGTHFARPGNRFWPALHRSGFTGRQLAPQEQWLLLHYGLGITNLVPRVTATAAEVTRDELRAGGDRLGTLAQELRPVAVVVLGIQAFRVATGNPAAAIGRQPEGIGASQLWLLPNPSGLQARYQLPEIVEWMRQVRHASGHAASAGAGGTG